MMHSSCVAEHEMNNLRTSADDKNKKQCNKVRDYLCVCLHIYENFLVFESLVSLRNLVELNFNVKTSCGVTSPTMNIFTVSLRARQVFCFKRSQKNLLKVNRQV